MLLFYPTFNISRIIYYLTYNCGFKDCIASWDEVEPELMKCIAILYISPWILILIGIYLYEVLPKQYGIRRHPLFFLIDPFKKKIGDAVNPLPIEHRLDAEYGTLDEEVEKEHQKAVKLENKSGIPLVVSGLSKQYPGSDFMSLKDLNLVLEKDEIFGLLGPNGAGKTTFFSIMTGMYEPSSGEAWVDGNSIKESITKVQEKVGYCPQFDILWDELTVEEHLAFYCNLKNVPSNLKQKNIDEALENTKLTPFRAFLVKELSGGMKRRLSLGISLVGNPAIVFLDEPTTGLDPENKRQIWSILSKCKKDKSIILTTHLMEEAEVLSERIGIIIKGQLRCIGTQYQLKRSFGDGFKLVLNMEEEENDESTYNEEKLKKVIDFVSEIFPNSLVKEKFKNSLVIEVIE